MSYYHKNDKVNKDLSKEIYSFKTVPVIDLTGSAPYSPGPQNYIDLTGTVPQSPFPETYCNTCTKIVDNSLDMQIDPFTYAKQKAFERHGQLTKENSEYHHFWWRHTMNWRFANALIGDSNLYGLAIDSTEAMTEKEVASVCTNATYHSVGTELTNKSFYKNTEYFSMTFDNFLNKYGKTNKYNSIFLDLTCGIQNLLKPIDTIFKNRMLLDNSSFIFTMCSRGNQQRLWTKDKCQLWTQDIYENDAELLYAINDHINIIAYNAGYNVTLPQYSSDRVFGQTSTTKSKYTSNTIPLNVAYNGGIINKSGKRGSTFFFFYQINYS